MVANRLSVNTRDLAELPGARYAASHHREKPIAVRFQKANIACYAVDFAVELDVFHPTTDILG